MNPADLNFMILPQYGAAVLPFAGPSAPLLGDSSPLPRGVLFRPSPADTFLGTTAADLGDSTVFRSGRETLECLDAHNARVGEALRRYELDLAPEPPFAPLSRPAFRRILPLLGRGDETFDAWAPDLYPAVTEIAFAAADGAPSSVSADIDRNRVSGRFSIRQGGLELRMSLAGGRARTEGYVIRASDEDLRRFLCASLAHYDGVDGELLKDADLLFLSAHLIYHQQFVAPEAGAGPFAFQAHAVPEVFGADFEAHFRAGYMERCYVPAAQPDQPPPLEIKRLMDKSVEITIRRPAGFGPDLMPLRHNVLMLGARLMAPRGTYPDFVDWMAG